MFFLHMTLIFIILINVLASNISLCFEILPTKGSSSDFNIKLCLDVYRSAAFLGEKSRIKPFVSADGASQSQKDYMQFGATRLKMRKICGDKKKYDHQTFMACFTSLLEATDARGYISCYASATFPDSLTELLPVELHYR